LLRGGLLGPPIDLRHQKSFLPVAIAQRFTHADLALAVVVVPAVIQERDAAVERGPDDSNAFLLVRLHANVVSAQPYHRNLFARVTQDARGHNARVGCMCEFLAEGGHECSGNSALEEFSAIHGIQTPGSKYGL